MQAVVDNLLTEYEKSGTGKVLIFVHGWGDAKQSFKDLAGELSDKYTTVVLDLPGFGQTQAPKSIWGLDDYANFIKHFLKKINVEPHAFICHSNGGAVIIRGLAVKALSADKLVLIASSGIRGQYRGRTKTIRMLTKAGKAFSAPLPGSVKKRLRRKVYNTVGSDMLVAEHLQETFKKIINDDIQADASQLGLPTLLLYGDKDATTPPAHGQRLHKLIKGSNFQTVDTGHFVHHDQPDIVYKKIAEFLA